MPKVKKVQNAAVFFRLDEEMLGRVKAQMKRLRISKSTIVRMALIKFLEEEEVKSSDFNKAMGV